MRKLLYLIAVAGMLAFNMTAAQAEPVTLGCKAVPPERHDVVITIDIDKNAMTYNGQPATITEKYATGVDFLLKDFLLDGRSAEIGGSINRVTGKMFVSISEAGNATMPTRGRDATYDCKLTRAMF